jgi:hypothetical protein
MTVITIRKIKTLILKYTFRFIEKALNEYRLKDKRLMIKIVSLRLNELKEILV